MKNKYYLIFIPLLLVGLIYAKELERSKNFKSINLPLKEINEGDLIFQTSLSSQSQAIQFATKSIYSHCGIIFKKNKQFYVLEAIQPVKFTKLEKWTQRGKDEKFVIKRLKNANDILNSEIIAEMKKTGNGFLEKDYDLTFEWSDEKIYCSELIWKIYKTTLNIEIGKLQKLQDFDLSNKDVQKILFSRYGVDIPFDEIVISPEAIFQSDLLETIQSN